MILYQPVIGLEIHCQLSTRSKLFCGCANGVGAAPNAQTCPLCTGMPGSLPVLNQAAVDLAIALGLAMDCDISTRSLFARKNYFYPDLPKGYQITQFEYPLCRNGQVPIEVEGQQQMIHVERIHLEEDAGKNIHGGPEGHRDATFVDLNRAGTPLVEIVSAPVMHSPDQAVAYMKAVHALVKYLGVSDGNLERGNFRCDANISVREKGSEKLGTRVEIKNINSFRYLGKAILFEIERQIDILEEGGEIHQETRGYDADEDMTYSQRSKEAAHDYRYFPEPDLGPLMVDAQKIQSIRETLKERPWDKKARFMRDYGLSKQEAETLSHRLDVADYFEAAITKGASAKMAANWVGGEVLAALKIHPGSLSDFKVSPAALAELSAAIDGGEISTRIGKKIFARALKSGESPRAIIDAEGLAQVSDHGAIEALLDQVIAANPGQFEALKGGKGKLRGFFVGQVMRQSQGKANPQVVNGLLDKKLQKSPQD